MNSPRDERTHNLPCIYPFSSSSFHSSLADWEEDPLPPSAHYYPATAELQLRRECERYRDWTWMRSIPDKGIPDYPVWPTVCHSLRGWPYPAEILCIWCMYAAHDTTVVVRNTNFRKTLVPRYESLMGKTVECKWTNHRTKSPENEWVTARWLAGWRRDEYEYD